MLNSSSREGVKHIRLEPPLIAGPKLSAIGLSKGGFQIRHWLPVFILAALSYLANAIDLTLFNSVAFIFGSTFSIVALRLFGIPAAVVVSLIGSIYTVYAWGHYYAFITLVCEIVFVGYLLRRIDNVVLAVVLFWGFVGLPLVTLFYATGLGLGFESGSFIAIKQAVNGICNAVVAGLLLFILRMLGLPKGITHHMVSLRAMIFKVVAFVGVISTVVIIIIDTRSSYRYTMDDIERVLASTAGTVENILGQTGVPEALTAPQLDTLRNLLLLSRVPIDPLREVSISITPPTGESIVLLGRPQARQATGETELYSLQFGRWSPTAEIPEMQRSLESRYIYLREFTTSGISGEILVELSAVPVISSFETTGRQSLLTMAVTIALIMTGSHFLISWLIRPIIGLSTASAALADRITSGAPITPLPAYQITELDTLSGMMDGMAQSLAKSFRELDDLATTLEQRVNERTDQLSLMSQVAQQTTDAVIVTDPEGLTTWVNRSFERLTGYRLHEVLGKSPGSVLQKVRPPVEILDHIRASIARADSFHVELENYTKDGEPYWVEVRCSPMVANDGRHTGFIAIQTDVTERNNLTRSVQSSLQRLQLATEAANLGVWVYRKTTKTLEWNPLNYALHGLDETTDNDVFSLWLAGIHEDDRARVRAVFESDFHLLGPTMTLEYRFLDPARGTRTMVATFCALNTSDDTARLTGVTRDTTEEHNAQRQLEEWASHTQAILDNVIDGVVSIDTDGRLTSFNSAAEKIFGYTADEVIGRDITCLMTEEHIPHHSGFIQSYLATGRKKVMGRLSDFRARRKDGTVFPILLGVTEVKTTNSHFFIGIIRDATRERQLQEQLRQSQKLEAVGQLTGGISHDFNNLLTIIIGNAEMLSERLDDRADLRRLAGMILSAAENGAELISRLLAFSRQQSLKPKVADISLLLTGMYELLERSLGQSINLEFNVGNEPCPVLLDTSQFEAAILNLAINARDAMPDGGTLKIEISERKIESLDDRPLREVPDGTYFLLSVSDTGKGMDENTRSHAFDPFFTTKDVGKGSGLGLSMVFGFVAQSGGHVTIDSEPGKGTKVEMLFPQYFPSKTGQSNE